MLQVYLGLRDGVDQVAIKVLKGKQDARMQAAFAKEIEILSNARHPSILQYIGCCMREQHTFLVTEVRCSAPQRKTSKLSSLRHALMPEACHSSSGLACWLDCQSRQSCVCWPTALHSPVAELTGS